MEVYSDGGIKATFPKVLNFRKVIVKGLIHDRYCSGPMHALFSTAQTPYTQTFVDEYSFPNVFRIE